MPQRCPSTCVGTSRSCTGRLETLLLADFLWGGQLETLGVVLRSHPEPSQQGFGADQAEQSL